MIKNFYFVLMFPIVIPHLCSYLLSRNKTIIDADMARYSFFGGG